MLWQSRTRGLCGLFCASLAACSVGTPYRRPQIPLPQAWNAPVASGDPAPAPRVWPAADWWHGFGSAQLDDLIAEAERSNDDLAGAIARVQEADAQVRIAGAPLLPSVDLGRHGDARARQRHRGGTGRIQRLQSGAHRQLRARFLGQEPRAARRRARRRGRQPLRSADRRADRGHRSVATTYFQALELRDRHRRWRSRISPTDERSCAA